MHVVAFISIMLKLFTYIIDDMASLYSIYHDENALVMKGNN